MAVSKKIARPIVLAGLAALTLASCSFPGIRLYESSDQGESLNVGEAKNVHFFTKDPNFDTGINLQSGARYAMDIKILSYWIDSYIEENENREPLDERGFANSVMPFEFLASTKRVNGSRWFELMLYQSRCSRESLRGVTELEVDESGSYNFVATCDGELTLFVNDSHGFYSNNVGYANIALSRVN
ncbi:MAG: hypothetical protein OXU66_11325 [Gammaproteobacteria bacterium]|nr:hypothetical protein [Gammaproteobacteria bacterium]MDD9896426.1 hypothetical protein [Gammaproteobacteria bacterium]MDD9959521.1 hypothetical protein [Gammaproteobacteria bacterium]